MNELTDALAMADMALAGDPNISGHSALERLADAVRTIVAGPAGQQAATREPAEWLAADNTMPPAPGTSPEGHWCANTGTWDQGEQAWICDYCENWMPAQVIYTLAELRNGTGFPPGARFILLPGTEQEA